MTETLDPDLLIELWNEPVFYFIYGGFSLLWSRTGSRMLGLNADYARLCDVATFFSNTNTLPVSLIKSIALSAGSQFLLKDQNDTPMKVAARGVSYAMIFATLNNILRWSFGVALMGGISPKNKSAFNSVNASPRSPASANTIPSLPESPGLVSADRLSSYSNHDDADELTPLYLGAPARPLHNSRSFPVRVLRNGASFVHGAWSSVKAGITPPVYAILAAFLVILIDPLHEALMNPNSVLYTVWSAIDMCGDACVPLILISLGGQLGMMARQTESQTTKTTPASANALHGGTSAATRSPSAVLVADAAPAAGSGIPSIVLRTATDPGSSSAATLLTHPVIGGSLGTLDEDEGDNSQTISVAEQRKGIVMVLVGRFVFVPTMAIALISVLRIFFPHWLPIMVNDPVYILALLILSGTPPAINLITVSQATGKFETEAAQILFYGYVLGIFVLAIEVSGFLWLTSAFAQM
ncbi:hypothetical protein H4R99_001627 [Coemansia sp. RSA 1722]|nr:hypothetical protein IWW45_003405 [Coemansia sp. RSA 485]KAJ2604705.1 hypothetical protein H4R99_001627 [Coemansia sp. RSA 1722]